MYDGIHGFCVLEKATWEMKPIMPSNHVHERTGLKLDLPHEKKIIANLVTNGKENNTVKVPVDNRAVIIDAKLGLKTLGLRTREGSRDVARMMSNILGPKYSRRLLITAVVK